MSLFSFASCHGAPGVTTTVMGLAAAWRSTTGRDVVVIEADPDGGVLASRFDGLRADRSLADVVVNVRRSFDIGAVTSVAQHVWGAVPVVVAPPSAEETHSALSAGGDRLAAGLASSTDVDVLVDVGRLTPRSPALHLARRSVATIFVSRPTFEATASAATRIPEISAHGCEPSLLLVGDRPYSPEETQHAVGAAIIGVLPHDERAAGVFAGGPGSERHVRRSLLWRSFCELSSRLVTLVPPTIDLTEVQPSPASIADHRARADA
jgi:MinD-like ATPase involved in chromosome partitioning or flagellar assembly